MGSASDNLYLIALGTNLGEREANLARAAAEVAARLGPIAALAQVYETAPVGAADQLFLNSALVCTSALAPDAALAALLAAEEAMGRVRREKWGNRVIDLDLLLWREGAESRVWDSDTLSIPHPYLLERDFVLVPACDVAGDWTHPMSGLTLAAELSERGFRMQPKGSFPLGAH